MPSPSRLRLAAGHGALRSADAHDAARGSSDGERRRGERVERVVQHEDEPRHRAAARQPAGAGVMGGGRSRRVPCVPRPLVSVGACSGRSPPTLVGRGAVPEPMCEHSQTFDFLFLYFGLKKFAFGGLDFLYKSFLYVL